MSIFVIHNSHELHQLKKVLPLKSVDIGKQAETQ